MENKKSKHANLENKKSLYFQIGLLVATALALVAFEWTNHPSEIPLQYVYQQVDIEEDIKSTRQDPVEKPPPPPPPQVIEVIVIHDDDDIIEDVIIEGIDDDEDIYIPPIDDDPPEVIPAVFLDEQPSFQGGDVNQFRVYIANNLIYPAVPADNGIAGRVHLQFTVNTRGYVENVIVVKSVHPDIDREAIRVVKSSPKWKPGKQAGRPVKAQYQFSILFTLQ